MKRFQPQDNEPVTESRPDILSIAQSRNKDMLAHLQTAVPSPLDLLLNRNAGEPNALLNHVAVRPAPVEAPKEEKPLKVCLGPEARLSECPLWQIQSDFYASRGIDAWKSSVPTFITSSAYIAEAYAEMVLAFVEDYFERLDLSEPLYIVEMATGTGRFSHLMLRELESKLSSFSKYKDLRFRYIMTDFTESNPNFWQQHDRLTAYVEKGVLDFAVLNPLVQDSLTLMVSGETLAAGSFKNPVIAIANYFFDSIRQDIFRVESKVLKEGLVTLERKLEGVDESTPVHISQVSTKYRYRELRHDNYYDDPRFNAVLKHYRHNVRNGTILFPLGALEVIRNLEHLSGNRLMLISSDKSYTNPEDMTQYYYQLYAQHDGAFSYMVNYHAIGQYFLNEQGYYFYTDAASHSIHTVCCLRLDEPDLQMERLTYLYKQKLNRMNTINSICAIMPDRDESKLTPPVEMRRLLGHIRLNLCDPQIFFLLGQRLADISPKGWQTHKQDLVTLMDEAWQNYYYFPGESNIPFWFAQIYFVLDMYEKSIEALDWALHYFGPHEILHFLRGQNFDKLHQWEKSQECYLQALALKADFDEAHVALSVVEGRLKGKP